MRKILFLLLAFAFSSLNAQTLQQLERKIDSLQTAMIEKNYYHIPVGEIDQSLNTMVSNEVSGSIKSWIIFLSLLISLVGFLVGAYAKGQIKDSVEEKVAKKFESLTTELQRVEKALKTENEGQNKKLDELEEKIGNLAKEQQTFIQNTLDEVNLRLNNILKTIWDDIAEGVISRAVERNYQGQDIIDKMNGFLEDKNIQISSSTKVKLIDSLMRCYYSAAGDPDRYKKMIDLLKKYESQFEMPPETYASAAIALNNIYEQYGLKEDKDACIEYCDKSIKTLRDYGTAYAVKLEVQAMYYHKAFDDKEKNEALDNLKQIFKAIDNNTSIVLCIEIIDRLDTDRPIPYLKKYIESLEKLFPDQIIEIKQRACSDIFLTDSYMKKYKTLFDSLLLQGLQKTTNLNGTWKPVKVIQDGKIFKTEDVSFTLELLDEQFQILQAGYLDKGLVQFIPYTTIAGINYYSQEGNNANRVTRAIYKIENNQLVTCSNYNSETRPEDFTSTPENKFYLVYYEKLK